MLTLTWPYKLERKVMLEKAGINRYIVLKRTRDIKMSKIKRNICNIIATLTSLILGYSMAVMTSLNLNLFNWDIADRLIFLIFFLCGIAPVGIYCKTHIVELTNGRDEEITIKLLSFNWFKKLLSIYIIFFIIVFVFYLLFSFCLLSFDISKTTSTVRCVFAIIIYVCACIAALAAHLNHLKIILKIEQP